MIHLSRYKYIIIIYNIYIFIDVEFDSTYQGILYRNNVRKCLIESNFLASCSGTPFKVTIFPKFFGK